MAMMEPTRSPVNVASMRPSPPVSRSANGTRRPSSTSSPIPAKRRESVPLMASTPERDDEWSRCSREVLVESLKRLKEEKEQTLVKLESTQTELDEVSQRNKQLNKDLSDADHRYGQVNKDQSRLEEELLTRNEVSDKLRKQLREVEREKRELEKRYRDQTGSFDAERQSWYDNERHLKAKVASLSSSPPNKKQETGRKGPHTSSSSDEAVIEEELDDSVRAEESDALAPLGISRSKSPTLNYRSGSQLAHSPTLSPLPNEVAQEMDNLRYQLATLNTSHDSVSASFRMVQEEVADLKRVNQQLMDENQSYEVLLGERTLSGELLGQGIFAAAGKDWTMFGKDWSITGGPGSEEARDSSILESHGSGSLASGAVAAKPTAPKRKPKDREVPMAGMDLAAELEKAEVDRAEAEEREAREARKLHEMGPEMSLDADGLRSELKSVREANKALSLYVAKILERIVTHDGFEKILANDDDDLAASPSTGTLQIRIRKSSADSRRPSSVFYRPSTERSYSSPPLDNVPLPPPRPTSPPPIQPPIVSNANVERRKSNRMSLTSLQGLASSLWAGQSLETPKSSAKNSPTPPPGFKPMILQTASAVSSQPSAPSMPSPSEVAPPTSTARKLDTQEDEDDARERARLHAEMKLYGIDLANGSVSMSFAGSTATSSSGLMTPSPEATPPLPPSKDLEHIQSVPFAAIEVIKSIEQREKEAKMELEKGRASGFTEVKPIGSRRRPSSRGSGSSAGRSGHTSTSVSEESASVPTSVSTGTSWTKAFRRMSAPFSPPPPPT